MDVAQPDIVARHGDECAGVLDGLAHGGGHVAVLKLFHRSQVMPRGTRERLRDAETMREEIRDLIRLPLSPAPNLHQSAFHSPTVALAKAGGITTDRPERPPIRIDAKCPSC